MATDWSALKAKRVNQVRRPPFCAFYAPLSIVSTGSSTLAAQGSPVPYSHPDLPSFLKVQQLPNKGRGVVAKRKIIAGSTLLTTSPLVAVLDNRHVPSRCSYCSRAQDDAEQQKPLLQCSLCHVVQYCSGACQQADWKLHKKECKALKAAAKAAGKKVLPDSPVRALARLLWKRELEGDKLWQEVESLQSHRDDLLPEEQERFFQLSVALAQYTGSQELLASAVGGSGKGMLDLCSRFTSNSFSLTSPADVSNIGVAISPLTALFNHSCAPNAVVVFPSFPSPSKPKNMAVVAIRDIEAGEEVLTSYVDLALPREERQKELKERYYFDCRCEACEAGALEGEVEPRAALVCSKQTCKALIPLPVRSEASSSASVSCSCCKSSAPYQDVYPAIDAAKLAFADAEKAQYSDPHLALRHLTNAIDTLTASLAPTPPLAPSSHPLFSSLQLLLTLQLHAGAFSLALPTARQAWLGASTLYPPSHPVRAVLLSTLARLETIPPPPDAGPAAEIAYWSDEAARARGIARLAQAVREAEGAFGKESAGGEMGRRLRALLRDQEEGVAMARRVRQAGGVA
ncbi:hypothetical protein JCM10207_004115 [Rhodosporidiobolus poonsookiae]